MLLTNFHPAFNKLNINQPAVNTYEEDASFVVELALPGWDKSEISLEVDGDLLLVKGKHASDKEIQFRRREFGLTKFEKSFHLPDTVDVEKIEASLDKGILAINLPKVPEALPVRKAIEVA